VRANACTEGGVMLAPRMDLDPDAVYLAPSGRRCRLLPDQDRRAPGPVALLLYDLRNGQPAASRFSDGFTLSRSNFYLLRRVR